MTGSEPDSGEPIQHPASARLSYRRLRGADSELFHQLATDAHIRQFLMDGQTMTRDWSQEVVNASDALFSTAGVGIWLVFERESMSPIGFGGYRIFDELGDEPQLLYALREAYTGHGYATEIARALIDYARTQAGFGEITAAVDEPNRASVRVLEKVGFVPAGEAPGLFGKTLLYTLPDDRG